MLMSDFETLLRDYYEEVAPPLDTDRLIDGLVEADRRRRRPHPLVVFVAAALVTGLVIGGLGVLDLFSGDGTDVVDTPPTVPAPIDPTPSVSPEETTPTTSVDVSGGILQWRLIDDSGLENVVSAERTGVSDIAVSPAGFVAVGAIGSAEAPDAAIFTSPNGEMWTQIQDDPELFSGTGEPCGMSIDAVTWGQEGYVAIGWTMCDQSDSARVWRSADGQTWSRSDIGEVLANSVVYGDFGYVAVGDDGLAGGAWVSPDGLTWSQAARDQAVFGGGGNRFTAIADVAYGPNGYVGVGYDDFGDFADKAAVWLSPDGVAWTRVGHDETVFGPIGDESIWFSMVAVAYGNGRYVAVGEASTESGAAAWVSLDGLSWELVPLDIASRMFVSDVTYGETEFVAVGYDVEAKAAAIWVSSDGLDWSRLPHDSDVFGGPDNPLIARHVAYQNGRYIVTGTELVAVEGSNELDPGRIQVWIGTGIP